MPNINGIAFVKELKKRPDCKFMPTIMPFEPANMLMAIVKLITP